MYSPRVLKGLHRHFLHATAPVLAAFAAAFAAGSARAQGMPAPPASPDASVASLRSATVLGEAVGRFSKPADFTVEDFTLEWVGDPVPGVTATLEKKSLEWVRVDKGHGFLDVPRARIAFDVHGASSGQVRNSGFSTPLAARGENALAAAVTVPMLSGPRNPITVTILRGGAPVSGILQLRFTPRPATRSKGRVYRDVTCSGYGLTVESTNIRDDEWAYVGCNLVIVASAEHRTSFLELFVLWDGVGDTVEIGGVPTPPVSDSLWVVQALPETGQVTLASGEHTMVLRYHAPTYPHRLSVGAGIGAYYDSYELPPQFKSFRGVEPLFTGYASWTLSPSSRLAAFDATPIREAGYTDVGFYLQQKSTELLDRRAVLTVFLGGHMLIFKYKGEMQFRPSAPQGGELLLRDVFEYGSNLTIGGLINPGLAGKYYFNGYLRWGSPRLFVEFNYIAWREHDPDNGDPIDLRSAGISIGGPLFFAF